MSWLSVCHCDQIRFSDIPLRQCRLSGKGVDGNAFHRIKTSHKRCHLARAFLKTIIQNQHVLVEDTSVISQLEFHTAHHRIYFIHPSIYFCCLYLVNTFLLATSQQQHGTMKRYSYNLF